MNRTERTALLTEAADLGIRLVVLADKLKPFALPAGIGENGKTHRHYPLYHGLHYPGGPGELEERITFLTPVAYVSNDPVAVLWLPLGPDGWPKASAFIFAINTFLKAIENDVL